MNDSIYFIMVKDYKNVNMSINEKKEKKNKSCRKKKEAKKSII